MVDLRLVSQEFEPANLRVSLTGDVDGVYKNEVERLSGSGPMKPTLLLIAKRLGHDNVNPQYYRSLKAFPIKFSANTSGPIRATPSYRHRRRTAIIVALFLRLPGRVPILPRPPSPPSCSPSPRRPLSIHPHRNQLLPHPSATENTPP